MMQISQIVFLALMELLFVLLVTVAVTAFYTLRRRSRERVAAKRLAAKIKKALPERASQVNGLVQSAFAEDATQQQEFGNDRFVDPERKLMSHIINTWVHRNPAAFAGLDVAVNECIQPWVDCVQAVASMADVGDEIEVDSGAADAATADAPEQVKIDALMDDIEVTAAVAPGAVVEPDDDIDIEISPDDELSADEAAAIVGDAHDPESVSEAAAPPEKQTG